MEISTTRYIPSGMEWFADQFLPSLEKKYRERGKLWLTAKQVNVCKQYMGYGALRGQRKLDIGGKRYAIQIAPNGCANFFVFDL